QISLAQWSQRLKHHSGAKLLVFLFAMQAAVYISGPYFTPYMLRKLDLSYLQYMVLVSTCLVGKALALPFWGRFAHRYGAQKLLLVGACAILPLSSLWIFSTSFWYCAAIQLLSGLTWAAFELAIVLMFFEAIPRHERASLVTLYNVSNSLAMVCGTFLGAGILSLFGSSITGYCVIFGLSSFARVFAVLLLSRLSHVEQPVPYAVEGALALHPATNSLDKPILPSIPDLSVVREVIAHEITPASIVSLPTETTALPVRAA
ncbi:MAG TPA: MFS transporter, partial [Pirellulaceae bacterium]|nr:MFS transporter [Pirellulaceae bacterium]